MSGETQFFVQPAETRVGRIALVTIDNGEDYTKPSTFGRAAFESLWRALERLEGEEWAGLVLTGKRHLGRKETAWHCANCEHAEAVASSQ